MDIEYWLENGERELRTNSRDVFRGADSLEVEAKLNFFLECSRLCQAYRFKREIDRLIMELFCDGIPQQTINVELEKMGIKRERKAIERTVKKHLILFGLYGK